MTKTELVNAVGATWDACIRIIPVGERAKAVLFSHKGALIATHGEYCVEIFDAMAGINRATFAQRRSISSVAFSPDDDFLVSGLLDGTIHIWEVQTGTLFRMFTGHIGDALSLAFSPCGTLIASGGTTGTVRIWNISSGCCDSNLQGHSGLVKDVCWLAAGKQVISVSDDCTVRIWDIEQKTRSKIFAEYTHWVNAVDVSPASFLVASVGGNVIVYDSQSGDVIEAINTSEVLTRPRFSINGHEILLAGRNSGYVWDLTRKRRVQHIDYNGTCATFSPDGTCIASIYGMFLKIWKTTTGYKHHKASTHLHDAAIDNVYISPDDRLVVLKSINSAQILDATTGQSLFTFAHRNIISIVFTPKFAFVACLYRKMDREWSKPEWDLWGSPSRRPRYLVEIWNAQTRKSDKFIEVDKDVFHIALSSDGSRLVSLSSSYMRLLDLESNQCLALWEFFLPSWGVLGHPIPHGEACVSFAINGRSVSVDSSHGKTSWYIFPMHNTYPTHNFGRNWWRSGPKPPMYFVPFTKERSYQDASAPSQSYHCGKNGEWILDQHGRHVLWIPLDERPRLSKSNKGGRTVVLGNEGGKFYIVNFSLS
jgi:WD40 repeat protein